ncbi:ParA family protein [uncultured Massilia sp.]|uniref:ParA family protein n=1 Tax=uncultured Massilia sp. TaxID=169973 RepID=UPI0025EDBDAB|nr:ParA family protein [uncultured Massilia sp.]
MKTFIPANQKGGVGKTNTAFNFTHYLAEEGKRVLGVDGDEQGNYSRVMSEYVQVGAGASQLFGDAPVVLPDVTGAITVLPADKAELRAVERAGASDAQLVSNLRMRLAELAPRFDYLVIDSAGSNSRIANALLFVSDFAVIPTKIDQDSIDVSVEVLKRVVSIRNSWNPGLVNLGILPNEYDSRQPAQVKSLKALLGRYPQHIFPAYIADRSAYREASAAKTPVWRLKSETDGRTKTSAREAAVEMRAVFRMLLDRMEAQS